MWRSIESCVFTCIILTVSFTKSDSVGGDYNDSCELYDETSNCDHSKGLMCLQTLPGSPIYKCKCPSGGPASQFSTTYDTSRSRCVGKVFNTCVQSTTKPLSSTAALHGQTSNKTAPTEETYFCVPNAECDHSVYHLPLCICRKGFYATDEGFCVATAKYGSPCDNVTARCDERHGLLCSNLTSPPTCQCKDNVTHQYSPEEQRCVTLVNGLCSSDREEESTCISNSRCEFSSRLSGGEVMPGIIPGPVADSNRPIVFRSPSTEDLSQGMGNKPLFPMINMEASRRTPPGTHHRFFDTFPMNRPKTCQCLPGFSPTKSGQCLRSFGFHCDPMETKKTELCNSEQFLECVDDFMHSRSFRCGCRNKLNERWDSESKKCVSRLGRHCRPNSDFYPPCESGAECDVSTSICTCKKGTSPTPQGTCALDYTEKCNPGECNAFKGLSCHGKTGTCLCVDSFLTYNPTRGSCVAGRNSPCGPLQEDSKTSQINSSGSQKDLLRPVTAVTPFIHCADGLVCRTPDNEESFLQFRCVNKTN